MKSPLVLRKRARILLVNEHSSFSSPSSLQMNTFTCNQGERREEGRREERRGGEGVEHLHLKQPELLCKANMSLTVLLMEAASLPLKGVTW